MKKSKIITIFGTGHIEENFPEYQKAILLGRMLAENGFTVCTGGYGGIMEAALRGAKQVGGKTMGIVTKELSLNPNRWVDKIKTEKTWKDRLFRLIHVADAFVVFDGGTGTFTEMFLAWEMINKKIHQKPILIHGTWMVNFIKRLRKQRLILFNENLLYTPTARDVIDCLEEVLHEESDAE